MLLKAETSLPRKSWRRVFLLLGMFFSAVCVSSLIPTPGSWSDVRSQWLGPALIAAVCIVFLVATAHTYSIHGPLTGFQAVLLSMFFGVVLIFIGRELYVSALFLREVRGHHALLDSGLSTIHRSQPPLALAVHSATEELYDTRRP